jgi:nitroreductase
MELKTAISGRRSIRAFQEKPIEKRFLGEILNAGIFAPTAGNIQPWAFFCVSDPRKVHDILVVSPGILSRPVSIICICSDRERAFQKAGKGGELLALMDCAMAAQNIMLQAFDLGIGSCVIRSFNQLAVRELLGAPERLLPELLVTLGYPAQKPVAPKRKTDVIYWEEYKEDSNG